MTFGSGSFRAALFATSFLALLFMCTAAAASQGRDGMYVRGGAGALFFTPPERDSLPFYTAINAVPGPVGDHTQTTLDFDPDDTTWTGELALGYGFETDSGLLGEDFRMELSGNFAFPDFSDSETAPLPELMPGASILVGAFYSEDGIEGLSLLGSNDGSGFLPDRAPRAHFTADYDYWDLNVMAISNYSLVQNRVSVSPRIGITYASLVQDLRIKARTPDALGFVGGRYDYRADEELDTYYLGMILGADLVFQVLEGLTISVGGDFCPLYSHADMDLDYTGDYFDPTIFGKGDLSTGLSDSDSEFSYRAQGKLEAAYCFGMFMVSLTGQVEYWDYVPTVEYPQYDAGDWAIGPPAAYDDAVPELDEDSMTNFAAMLKMTVFLP